ncbi:response regulator transcription factor [Deinococcus navajonensis]|uniref:Response regulator transcription factor n=1 Tax=Deinococcus navajonensis TaxID=309884 RepID=A0ABV8XR86_9DEIO
MQRTILVIEDDPDIRRIVKLDLEDAGFRVLTAENGAAGLTAVQEQNPDLVVLDLGLPDVSGEEVALRIRKTSHVPIVVLTAFDDVEQKIHLLCAGADDYLTKPFDPGELAGRIRVALQAPKHRELVVGELKLLPEARRCLYGHRDVRLTDPAFDLLWLLAQRPGYLHSPEELGRTVSSGEGNIPPTQIEADLKALRDRLREVGASHLLRTVPGVGVTLMGPSAAH